MGVPTGPGTILFNLGKIYDETMYPHLFANWAQVFSSEADYRRRPKCIHCYQPPHVLEKPPGKP